MSVGKASEDGKAALSPAPPPAASPFTAAEDVLTSQDDDQAVLYALACSNDRTLGACWARAVKFVYVRVRARVCVPLLREAHVHTACMRTRQLHST